MLARGSARSLPPPPAMALALAGVLVMVASEPAAVPTPGWQARALAAGGGDEPRVERRALHAELVPTAMNAPTTRAPTASTPTTRAPTASTPTTRAPRNATAFRRRHQDPIVPETRTTDGSTFYASPPVGGGGSDSAAWGSAEQGASALPEAEADPKTNQTAGEDQTSRKEVTEEETTITRAMYHAPPTPSPASFYVDDA